MSELTGEKMQDIYDAAVRVEFNEKQGKSEDATFDFLCVMGADLADVSATVRKLIDMVRARDVELLAVREAQPVVEVKPYGYLRENNGQVQISIGPIRPADRASGYATPWGAIYAAPPAPAVQHCFHDAIDDMENVMAWIMKLPVPTDGATAKAGRLKNSIAACRAAMLQPVSQAAAPTPTK